MKFKDFCIFKEGYVNPSQKIASYFGGPIKWLRATDLNNSYVHSTSRTLTEEGFKSAGKSSILFKPDTIAISKSGTIGRLGILKDYMCGNRAIINIEVNQEKMNLRYVFYWLLNEQNYIQNLAVGTVQKNLYISVLEQLEIVDRPLREQKAIADILSALDNKIELNHQINQDLEEMAQAIFKSWFIDFEPFRDGEFVDSELGPIPKGWRVVKLEEVIDIYDSKRIPLSKKQRKERAGIFPYYGATGIIDYVDDYLFDGIYILLGEDGSVINDKDRPFVQYVWGRFWVNNHAHVLKGKSHVTDELLYTFLKQVNIKPYITGAVQLKLNQKNMKKVPFLLPTVNVLDEIGEKFSSIFDLIRKNNEENIILSNLRDTLLPKLMSGEIRV